MNPSATTVCPSDSTESPDAEGLPRIQVQSWRLIRAPVGTLHLVTFVDAIAEQAAVRVSSAITAVHRGRVVVSTSSGSTYELAGPAEEREIEREVLRAGAVRLGMGRAVDVSLLAWDHAHFDRGFSRGSN